MESEFLIKFNHLAPANVKGLGSVGVGVALKYTHTVRPVLMVYPTFPHCNDGVPTPPHSLVPPFFSCPCSM